MKITAISSDANLQRYGYKHTRLIEGKLSKNLRNLIKASIDYYNYHFYYMLKYDYSKLKQFDAIVFTTPPKIPFYIGAMFTGSVYPFLLVAESYSGDNYYILTSPYELQHTLRKLNISSKSKVLLLQLDNDFEYDEEDTLSDVLDSISVVENTLSNWK